MDVNIPFNPSVTPPKVQSANTQSQQQSGEGNKKQFDPEQLKEEKLAQEAGREFADKGTEVASSANANAATVESTPAQSREVSDARRNAEWSRTGGTPNWSSLSAQTQGYTVVERALNLYRHISAIPV
ncbi:hypothetical protein CWE09_07270 [Aliidiomarina minuta]|uniref:Uncharacterized protein n=1 Tax=Aliidiomarina minuta TaxID=880057 RepID=A0A432W8N7_9GAMM|nr:hypothetical protein [Aliidiomarina minuta]RUO26500.1 hypothetical protein CWE09_07270 [Aliidiomarina minuta]